MVCYARTGTGVLVAVLAVLFLAGGTSAHLMDIGGLVVALSVVFGVALLAAAATFVAVRTVQHRRAAAGGCVGCQFQCQHAMTGPPPSRLSLIRVIDRELPPRVLLPMPTVRIPEPRAAADDATVPRWPDRPVTRTGVMIRSRSG